MPTVVYIHGFLSSPQSTKAVLTQSWLQANRPSWRFECPFLSSSPVEAKGELSALLKQLRASGDKVFLIGSSLGGFWATYFAEQLSFPAVVINPSVHPASRIKDLVGETIKNYYTDDSYVLTEDDCTVLERCDSPALKNVDLFWLMAQKGDEVLDYRDALVRYEGCRQTIEDGGNHSFEGYEYWIPEIIRFFEE